MLGKKNS